MWMLRRCSGRPCPLKENTPRLLSMDEFTKLSKPSHQDEGKKDIKLQVFIAVQRKYESDKCIPKRNNLNCYDISFMHTIRTYFCLHKQTKDLAMRETENLIQHFNESLHVGLDFEKHNR